MKVPKSWLIAKVWKEQAEKLLWVSKLREDIKEGLKAKYRNRKVVYNGINFDSEGEKDRYIVLAYWESIGKIKDLKLQPKFLLSDTVKQNWKTFKKMYYIADFEYIDSEGRRVVEDFKGHRTQVYINKVKILLSVYKDQFIFLESRPWSTR